VLTVPPTTKLWFASAVDLRLGFDGLANLVRTQLSADPLSGHLFVFTNRSANRVKVLYWGGHGLCLWCQRLEAGRYHFPEVTAAGIELSAAQFAMILDGIDTSRVRRFKRFSAAPTPLALLDGGTGVQRAWTPPRPPMPLCRPTFPRSRRWCGNSLSRTSNSKPGSPN
jgi:transposase